VHGHLGVVLHGRAGGEDQGDAAVHHEGGHEEDLPGFLR